MKQDRRATKAQADSSLHGVRRMAREDRRYSAEVFALQRYLDAFERLILTEPPVTQRKPNGAATDQSSRGDTR